MKVRFNVNGEAVEVEARANEMLLDVLRRELGLDERPLHLRRRGLRGVHGAGGRRADLDVHPARPARAG